MNKPTMIVLLLLAATVFSAPVDVDGFAEGDAHVSEELPVKLQTGLETAVSKGTVDFEQYEEKQSEAEDVLVVASSSAKIHSSDDEKTLAVPPLSVFDSDLKRIQLAEAQLRQASHRLSKLVQAIKDEHDHNHEHDEVYMDALQTGWSIDKAVEDAKQHLKELWEKGMKLKEDIERGFQLLGKLLGVLKNLVNTFNCVVKDQTMRDSIGMALRDPKEFAKELERKIAKLIPLVLQATTLSVDKAQEVMTSLFNGKQIDTGALLGDMKKMVHKLTSLEPVLQCMNPMIDDAFAILQEHSAPQSMMIQQAGSFGLASMHPSSGIHAATLVQVTAGVGAEPSLDQRIVNWLIDVPWKQVIAPTLPVMFKWILDLLSAEVPKLIKGIMSQPGITTVLGVIDEVIDKLIPADVLKNAFKALQDAGDALAKNEALKTIAKIVSGKISFQDIAKFAVGPDARSALVETITRWVDSFLPLWYETVADTAIGFITKATSFVVEEILAEPLPLSMWAMEAIGSAIMEPIKSVLILIKQQGSNMMSTVTKWIITGAVNVIFDCLHPFLSVTSGFVDEVASNVVKGLKKALKPFTGPVEAWIGRVTSFIDTIPPEITGAIMYAAKSLFDTIMAVIAPRLKGFLDYNKATFEALKSQVCGAVGEAVAFCKPGPFELEFVQLQADMSEEDILTELKGSLVYSPPRQDQYQSFISFEEFAKQHSAMPWANPDGNGRGGIHRTPRAERPHSDMFVSIVRDLHAVHLHKASASQFSKQDMKALHRLVGTTLPSGRALLDLLLNMKHPSTSSSHNKYIREELVAIRSLLGSSEDQLVQTDLVGAIAKMIEEEFKTFACLFKAVSEKMEKLRKAVDGKDAGQTMMALVQIVETDMHKMFNLLGKMFTDTLRKFSGDTRARSSVSNSFQTDAGTGAWGGSCTCPNGEVYNVGDNGDGCKSLACIGGSPGDCIKRVGHWSNKRVTCAAPELEPDDFMKTIMTPGGFNNMILTGMKEFSGIEPGIVCVLPLIEKGLNLIVEWEKKLVDEATKFFNEYVVNVGMRLMNDLMIQLLNKVVELFTGKADALQQLMTQVQFYLSNALAAVEYKMTELLQKFDKLVPGPIKKVIITVLRAITGGQLKLQDLLPLAFQAVLNQIITYGSDWLSSMLPGAWDAVMNIVGMLGLPIASLGLNVGIATGSCATEWISTGLTNILQQVYAFAQTLGKAAFFEAGRVLITQVMNGISGMMTAAFNFVMEPINTHVIKPADKFLADLVALVETAGKGIIGLIPKPVIDLLMQYFSVTMKQLSEKVAPDLVKRINVWKVFVTTLEWTGEAAPTAAPTAAVTAAPTAAVTAAPTAGPTTAAPTAGPTEKPLQPTPAPTTAAPTTAAPTTAAPTTRSPTTARPTGAPTLVPECSSVKFAQHTDGSGWSHAYEPRSKILGRKCHSSSAQDGTPRGDCWYLRGDNGLVPNVGQTDYYDCSYIFVPPGCMVEYWAGTYSYALDTSSYGPSRLSKSKVIRLNPGTYNHRSIEQQGVLNDYGMGIKVYSESPHDPSRYGYD